MKQGALFLWKSFRLAFLSTFFPVLLAGFCHASQISGTAYSGEAPIDGIGDFLWVNLVVGDPCGQHDVIRNAQVQADGRYRFEDLSDGQYYLYADTYNNSDFINEWWAGGGSTYYCYNAEPVAVSSGSPAAGIDFQLETGGVISGTVTSQGQPLAEICVTAYQNRCWRDYMNETITDGSGNYRIRGLPTGTYYLRINSNCINSKNYINEWYDDISEDYCDGATPVSVTMPGETAGIDVALEPGFPMDAQLMNVHRPDGSFYTYYSVIPHGFAGPLPGGIDAVTVTPPGGAAMALAWDSVWNEYSAIKDGSPIPGVYTFTAAAGGVTVTETDFQYQVRTIPPPDTASFSPGPGAVVDGKTPTFSWQGVDVAGIALYYRFEVVDDATGMRAWASGRAKDMFHCTVPAGKLLPDRTYRWRVRVTDSDNFIKVQNRVNSAWQYFTTAPVLADHSAVPAIHLDSFGTGTYRTGDRVNLEHWIKVVDHDGVAYDHATNTSSHTVTVTYPDSSVHPLHYLWSDGPHSAYYEFFDSNDPGELPVSGTYTFQVTDPDGNVGTTQEVFTRNVIDNISEDTLQPSLKNPTEHFINATFDNVRINDALFEDFDSYGDIDDLDLSKWRPWYSHAAIVGQALQFDVRDTVGRGNGGLHLVDPIVSKVQADVTVNSISVDDGPPRARISGYFFNDGVGDVFAGISVNGSRVFYAFGPEWFNEQDTYEWADEQTGTLMPVTLGQTVTVSMEWTGSALIFRAWDTNTPGTVYSHIYEPAGPVYPPIEPFTQLQARIQLHTDSTTPTFRWGKVAGATRYMVRIYNYDRSRTLWTAVVGDVDSVTVPPGILKPNSYYRYRITARDGHNGLWIGLDEWDTDNLSRTPAHYGDYYIFYTGSQQAQAPFVDLDGGGVETWTSRELGGTFLSFWLKVHDAQGVPGNIDTVTVILPGGAKLPLYHDPDSPWNTPTAGIYRMHDFPKPAPEGTYTFTAVDKDGHVDTVTEALTREPVDSVDPSSISIAVSGTAVDIDWDDVTVSIPDFYPPVFYRAEIYDQDYNRIYAFCTTKNRFHVTEGLLAPGTLYRLQITARREFFEENVDNGSQSTWTHGEAWPTFITGPLAGGIAAPTIDTANYGAAIQHNLNPNIADDVYLLIFEVDVTDADGVPGNIASVTVTYPDGITTRELHLDKTSGENQGRYTDVVLYSDPQSIPEGIYTFTATDAQGNWSQTTDALTPNVLPLPQNLAPADGALLDTTTPVFGWDPVSGAVSYRVQINNGYSGRIHQSDYLSNNSYHLPYGILHADRTYSYRVYAYRENYPAEDLDNFSTDLFFFSRWKHFRITPDPDSDGDGVPDSADAFPADPGEWQDTDADGIGDNADADDDNDSMPDSWESAHGLPSSVYSARNDADGDGITDLQEYMADTLPDDDTSYPSSAASPVAYKGTWRGTGTIVTPDEAFSDAVVVKNTVNGGTITAAVTFGSDAPAIVDGPLTNGVFFFDMPSSDAADPDCADWDVQGMAMLNADFDTLHLTLAGTFCGAGGGEPGSFEAWLTRSAGGFGAHIPLLLLDE